MISSIHSHRELTVWQKAMDLVVLIYQYTEDFPSHEMYGLISQMRRAAVSIPSNIAEGKKKGTRKDFRHFIFIAYGSGGELETQLEIAGRLSFGKSELRANSEKILNEIMRMLNGLLASLDSSALKPNT